MPKKEKSILKFTNDHFSSKLPIVIYCDFEANNKRIQSCNKNNDTPYKNPIFKQEAISFGMYIKSDYPNIIKSQYVNYNGIDAKKVFVEWLVAYYNSISKKLYNYSNAHKTVVLTPDQRNEFNNATNCYLCKNEFTDNITKIREHNHFNGKYRGAACQSCNTKEGKCSKLIPVFFHNGSKYDFHFLVEELLNFEDQFNKLTPLAKTSEEYISLDFGSYYRKMRILDSYRFLGKSLADVVKSLSNKDLKITRLQFPNEEEFNLIKTKKYISI